MPKIKLEEGFYWVKPSSHNKWEPAEWTGHEWFILAQGEEMVVYSDISVIGERIQPPKETGTNPCQ
jgi:hypothetical protein